MPKIFRWSITSSATTTTSARTRSSRACIATGRTTRFHEAIGDSIALSATPGYLKQIGLHRPGPIGEGRHRDPAQDTALAKVAFLPFGAGDRSMAVESVLGGDRRRPITTRRGGSCATSIRESTPPVARTRSRFRSRREIPRPREHALHPVLPRAHSAVPVSSRALQGGRLHRSAVPLLHLRQQGGRREAREDARRWAAAARGPKRWRC